MAATEIAVQIVHIEGPRKGQIDEPAGPVITVGRSRDADVTFPADLRIVSRKHAEIRRQGNSFLLVNLSPNGCLVNGRPADNVYLKQGDVLTFAEGGPKVSFLSAVKAAPRATRPAPAYSPAPRPAAPAAPPPGPTPAAVRPAPAARGEVAPYTIQYGTSIQSFKKPAVKLGRDASSDFVLDHPRVFGTHAELFFQQGQYFLRDLTESRATLLNGKPIAAPTPLQEGDVLAFGEGGPRLKYIGTGRFSEVIA
ncbi:MAG: FHA domain-containing protein [Thermodesulfobacteriota bacterium]